MRRRRFLMATSAAFATACDAPVDENESTGDTPERGHAREIFLHGVASGDPLQDRVILWTRVEAAHRVRVGWVIATDARLHEVVARGTASTDGGRDHTVKVDVDRLQPGTIYYYAFELDGVVSPVGRTRTLPDGAPEVVRLAVTSCSNYPHGYFNAYAAIAAREDLDAVVHLGDYIYEYANGAYGDGTPLARIPDPTHECLSLDDYRRRHATYKRDPDLQESHRRHAFITVWDDHEVANDSWMHGASNHQGDEGDWEARKAAAVRAYHEWMPIRDTDDALAIWRRFAFGDLVDLLMLDTRLAGREEILPASQAEAIADPARQLLGAAQERWLLDALAESRTIWRVLGQQTRMTQLRTGDGALGSMHPWDGYPAARDRILAQLEQLAIGGNLVIGGDVHSSRASELHRDPFADPPTGALAIELITPAVCSPTSGGSRLEELLAANPHIRWMDLERCGWLLLELGRTDTRATWYLTSTLDAPDDRLTPLRSYRLPRSETRLRDG